MIGRVLFVVFAFGPIVALWLVMSRVPRMRRPVALTLTGLGAGAATAGHFWPLAVLEILLTSVALALATVVVARIAERRRLGPGRPGRVILATYLFAGWLVAVLCCAGAVWKPGPFFPSAETVLPLPTGLAATVEPTDDGDCGSGSCTRTITVTGRPGEPEDELFADVRRHLKGRGWGNGCRPVGWLLDRSTACVELSRSDDGVTISLSGDRDDVRDLVTLAQDRPLSTRHGGRAVKAERSAR